MSGYSAAARNTVLIVMNALHSGGAEKSCIEIVRSLRADHRFVVVSLLGGGPAATELQALGVEVRLLEGNGPLRMSAAVLRLGRLLREVQPAAVLTFLYIADLVGGALARLLVPRAKVYWNIRNNVLSRRQTGALTYLVSRLNAWASRLTPDAVVYCSATARRQHELIGYRARRPLTVENRPDSVPFRFSAQAAGSFRARFAGDPFLFLFVGRYDPIKRIDLYVEACAALAAQCDTPVRFLIAGRDMDTHNMALLSQIGKSGHRDLFDLLGFVTDRRSLYSGADCLIVTSESEGSPNAVFEAMATGLPTVILATIGTEEIADPSVERLATRRLGELVSAMQRQVARGRRPAEARMFGNPGGASPPEHPLATFYRSALSCK